METQILALSDGAATALIIAVGAGGSFALVLGITLFTIRRTERQASQRRRRIQAVAARNGRGTFPARPFSHEYQIPRQESAHGATNGSRPAGSAEKGLPTAPWPGPANDED